MTKIFVVFSFMFVVSCARVIRSQSSKMMSPEANGGFGKGTLEGRLLSEKSDRLNFQNDKTTNSLDRDENYHTLGGYGELGLLSSLDAYSNVNLASPSVVGLKLQFLGKTKAEAEAKNFSSSIFAGVGGNSSGYSAGDSFLNEMIYGGVKKLEIRNSHREMGLVSGYRWRKDLLHYVSGMYQRDQVSGKVTKYNGPLQGVNFNYNQDGLIYSTGFFYYFALAHLKADYSHYISDWSRTRKTTINTVNLALGFDW